MSDTTVSRRSVAKGVAWTLPAVSIAAAAPSLAASPEEPVIEESSSYAEKCQGASQVPGGWPKQGYRVQVTVVPATAPAPDLLSAVLGNGQVATIVAGPTALGEGLWEYVLDAASSPSTITLTYTIGAGETKTATIPASPHCGDTPRA